jgi:two-component system response regulator YesN
MYKLLIVDDEIIERDAISYIVENNINEISEIREATNGQDSISVATVFNPDIIIMDIKMPGLNGIEASKILKKIDKNFKIIFLTAYDEFDIAHEAIKLGVEDFLVKPASDERVIEVLNKTLNEIKISNELRNQKKDMEEKLSQVSKYLENEFLNSVITGEIDEKQVVEYLRFMDIDFQNGFGMAIIFNKLDSNVSMLQFNMMKKRFTEKYIALLDKRKISFFCNQIRNTVYFMFYGYQKRNIDLYFHMLRDDFTKAKELVEHKDRIEISMGIGQDYQDISKLWQSFSQAKSNAKEKLMNEFEINRYKDLFKEESQKLYKCIMECEDDKIIPIVDDVLDEIISQAKKIEDIRMKIYEFLIILNHCFTDESCIKVNKTFDELKNINTKAEAKIFIQEYLYKIMEIIKESRTDKTHFIFEEIIKYINQNYNQNLKLEDMADKTGFSTCYFSKMFKKCYDCSFVDYITDLRVNEAKKLLQDPHINIKDITQQIGYVDPNYFTRVFKKHEGMTPSEYRNMMTSNRSR